MSQTKPISVKSVSAKSVSAKFFRLMLTTLFIAACALTFPIAAISYELIKFVGKYTETIWGKSIAYPGMLMQRLTTREPNDLQLEVALASIKAVLSLEEKYNLKEATTKQISMEEVDFENFTDIESSNYKLKDFLET